MLYDELKVIQRAHGYLPAEQLHSLAEKLSVPVSRIHSVASFYPHFRLTPPARADVRICADMSCHLRGADQLKAHVQQACHGLTDKEISVRDVSCLGRCDHAPAFALNDCIFEDLTPDSAVGMIRDILSGRSLPPQHHPRQPVPLRSDPYDGVGRYEVVQNFIQSRDWKSVVATLKTGGLRGMGGAGFPTGTKWEIVRNALGAEKYIVCNADESEPGTIKDRFIMQRLPHMVIEGMILAGLVTGAHRGILYIRHEYEEPQEILQREIERCYQLGVLGQKVMGSDLRFDLEIFVSPGGYICGEESALLEAIEGHRAEPRNKPPFPGTHGLWNKPTVINNVETFLCATLMLHRGLEWYKAQGVNGAQGLKFVGISGDVNRPGVYEVPMGTSYRELIHEYGGGIPDGKRLLGFAPSGPSSGYLPASMIDLPLDWNAVAAVGSMVGSGAIVVCDEDTCMLDMALNAIRFFRNESCGKCVPCRMGSQKMVDMLTGWCQGHFSSGDMQLMEELSNAMKLASICGLGQVVPLPLQSVLTRFPEQVQAHLVDKRCPAGVCFQRGAS